MPESPEPAVGGHGRGRHGRRELSLALSSASTRDRSMRSWPNASAWGAPFSEPVLGDVTADGPAAGPGSRSNDGASGGWRGVVDASNSRERIRAAGTSNQRVPCGGRSTASERWSGCTCSRGRCVTAIDMSDGSTPMSGVRRSWFASGRGRWKDFSEASAYLGSGCHVAAHAGADGDRRGVLRNLSGPLTIADLRGAVGQPRPHLLHRFPGAGGAGLGVLNLLPLPMLD